MRKPRYITLYGYFGPTSNVKPAPDALSADAVARVLGSLPPHRGQGGAK
ncbi:hypothetical protein N6H05_21020 [Sphingobium sp. WTD-1]|nr:hypothetical protein [Sphingobium sp. WTD-1]WIA55485.1 hypothetical protein N6H05_21020 [Sphingobium sp. WTD-1]